MVHTKLLAKLSCYGIDPALLSWIGSFLSNCFQYVKVDKSYSSILPVISGVPQGSVLGPILFILYVNDICTLAPVGATIKSFADDTKLYMIFTYSSVDPFYHVSVLYAVVIRVCGCLCVCHARYCIKKTKPRSTPKNATQ